MHKPSVIFSGHAFLACINSHGLSYPTSVSHAFSLLHFAPLLGYVCSFLLAPVRPKYTSLLLNRIAPLPQSDFSQIRNSLAIQNGLSKKFGTGRYYE